MVSRGLANDYNNVGNRLSMTDMSNSLTHGYTYDDAYSLTSENLNGSAPAHTYSDDRTGNRVSSYYVGDTGTARRLMLTTATTN